jgi:hypothetical protein
MESGPVMRPIWLAANLIRRPDEPDGAQTCDAATTAAMTEDCPGVHAMTAQIQDMLHTFDLPPDGDTRELASKILRGTLTLDVPPLSDEQLVGAVEELFLQLDRSETPDAC